MKTNNETFSQLTTYYSNLDLNSWNKLIRICRIRNFHKDEVFLSEGEIARMSGFVLSGSFKFNTYHNDEERVLNFSFQNDFMGSCSSYSNKEACNYSIIAMEESNVLIFKNDDMRDICATNQQITQFRLFLSEQITFRLEEHVSFISLNSPLDKYTRLLSIRPEFINNLSLTEIAKYLFTSRESLSRARSALSQQKIIL